MSRTLNKLTARTVESASYNGKDQKLFDGGGLYLLVIKSGKYWRLKYRYSNKEKNLALGVYPLISLAEARKLRDENRKLLAQGLDPTAHKKAKIRQRDITESNTFKAIALEWHKEVHSHKVVKSHAKGNLDRLTKYVFPKLGHFPITEITAPQLLAVLRELEKRGILETVSRVKSLCSQVFRYAISTERATRDPASDLKGALKTPEEKHHPAIIDPKEIGQLLRAIESYKGHPSTSIALRLAPLLFVRPGELRQALWKDFDLDAGIWNYTPSKNGLPFEFPLPRQAIQLLKEQKVISGNSKYIFPSVRSNHRPMSNNTVNGALHSLNYGGKMTAHGFRAMARTVLAERLNFAPEYIEQQLGHQVKDSLGRSYNRTTYFKQRKEMMQAWADYLDGLKAGKDNVIRLVA